MIQCLWEDNVIDRRAVYCNRKPSLSQWQMQSLVSYLHGSLAQLCSVTLFNISTDREVCGDSWWYVELNTNLL